MERTRRRHRKRIGKSGSYRLTDDDLKTFSYLATYRYLTPQLLAGLLGKKTKKYVTERLLLLMYRGYVRQYDPEDLPVHWPNFYMLDERGEDALIEDGLSPDHILRQYRASHEPNSRNFKHDFPACHVLATIHAGAQNAGVKVITWQETLEKANADRFKLPCTIQHTSLDGNYHNFLHFMVPDGFIGLQSNKFTYLTVEIERGNPIEPTKDLKTASALNKFLALRDIHKRAAWTKEERQLPNTKRPLRGYRKQLQISNMRTLFLFRSTPRMHHAIELCDSVIGPNNYCLFGHINFKRPDTMPDFYNYQWQRVGMEPTTIVVS